MTVLSNIAENINPDHIDLSLEAIDFQVDTKFADSICAIYQDIINYRETQRGNKKLVQNVYEYTDSKLNKEFPPLWKQHLGIKLSSVNLSNNPTFMFAMQPRMGSDRELAKVIDAMTGNVLYASNIDFSKKTYEEVKKISASFDRKKGRLGVSQFLKKDISMNFFFDPYVAFLTKDTLSIHLDYMTAEELTAITLHEVGHMMSLIEHCADMFFNVSLNVAIIKSFARTAPLSEKLKAVREITANKDAAAELSKNGKLKPQEADAAIKVAKNMEDTFNKRDNVNDSSWSFWATIANFFISMFYLGYTVIGWVYTPFYAFLAQLGQDIGISLARDYVQRGGKNDPKYSDYLANKTTAFNWERWADEYVTRFGYGSHLNNGLNHLFEMMAKTSMYSGMNDKGVDVWIRNSRIPMYMSYIIHFSYTFLLGGNIDDGYGIYESQVDRMKRVIQDTANVFKRMDLPQEVMDKYIKEFEDCENSLNNISMARRCEQLWGIVHKCIMSFLDPVQLANRLFRGNIKAEYADLVNDIDDLKSNKLFYNAAKLESIIARR